MNPVLIKNTLHRILTRPMVVAVTLAYAIFAFSVTAISSLSSPSFQVQGVPEWVHTAKSAWFLVWALGSGLLGQERSGGYLPLLLSRPISRAQYVLSRWAGLVISVVLIDTGLILLAVLWLMSKGQGPAFGLVLERWAWFAYFSLLGTAWLTLLSACFGGHGDLFYFFAASLIVYFLAMNSLGPGALRSAYEILSWFWAPGLATMELYGNGQVGPALYSAAAFTVAGATALALAAYVMQRRDISYVNR